MFNASKSIILDVISVVVELGSDSSRFCIVQGLNLNSAVVRHNGASETDRRMNFPLLRQANLRLIVIIPRLEPKERIIGVELLLGTHVECRGVIISHDGYFAKKYL
jgi:hypothetical protein